MSRQSSLTKASLDDCYQCIDDLCTHRGFVVRRLPDVDGEWLKFSVETPTWTWVLLADCSWPRYTALPTVLLVEPLVLLAHVGHDGQICTDDSQGLSVDIYQHARVVAHSVGMALDLLESSRQDAEGDRAEFNNELEGYWLGMYHAVECRTTIEVNETSRLIRGHVKATEHKWWFTEAAAVPPPDRKIVKADILRSLYVWMPEAPYPPAPGIAVDSSFITHVVSQFNPEQSALWNEMLGPSMNGRRHVALLIACPRAAGGLSVVGVSFYVHKRVILPASDSAPIAPLFVRRYTATYMRERGGASNDLAAKHLVVFGAGSVGSQIADALASSGIGTLTIVDPEKFSEDNVFRHRLGARHVGSSKVRGVKVVLEAHFPGLTVNAVEDHAQQWLIDTDLTTIDGMVFALGAPSSERVMMWALGRLNAEVPVVFTWLEALDLGGHAVAMRSNQEGCLECLYRDEEGTPVLYPRTTFLKPGQAVSLNLTGCNSTFVPYGAIQSRKTALLAAELLVDAVKGLALPAYRFWRGSGLVAHEQGLKTTPWWALAETTKESDATDMVFGRPCKHCRKTK